MKRSFALGSVCLSVILGLANSGCTTWNPFGPGFDDGTADWSDGYRTKSSSTMRMGVDGRSREIEGNLGIR